MRLSDLLRGRYVLLNMSSTSKEGAIRELVDFLIREDGIPQSARNPVLEAVFQRERHLTTGVEHGVALPHGVTDAVPDEVGALGLSCHGIPFDTLDGLPVTIMLLHLTPHEQSIKRVHTLARFAQLVSEETLRRQLRLCEDTSSVLRLISTLETDHNGPQGLHRTS